MPRSPVFLVLSAISISGCIGSELARPTRSFAHRTPPTTSTHYPHPTTPIASYPRLQQQQARQNGVSDGGGDAGVGGGGVAGVVHQGARHRAVPGVYRATRSRTGDCLKFGDEIEYLLLHFDPASRSVTLSLRGPDVPPHALPARSRPRARPFPPVPLPFYILPTQIFVSSLLILEAAPLVQLMTFAIYLFLRVIYSWITKLPHRFFMRSRP
jgi:hypothetical protein